MAAAQQMAANLGAAGMPGMSGMPGMGGIPGMGGMPGADDDESNKQRLNKQEKKARKAIQKLGMKLQKGFSRVTIKKSKNVKFFIFIFYFFIFF